MTFTKYASAVVLDARVARAGSGLVKDAHRHEFQYDPRPGFLYVRSRAISSRTNDNFDHFPAAEIKKAYRTFIGKPVFVNHHNDNHRRARGVIVDAALHEDTNPDGSPDTWTEVLMEVDAIRFPKLAQAILAGEIDRTSMGTDVEFSVCSVCNNRAETPLDYCQHIPKLKGKKIRRTTASGGKEDVLCYEKCYGLGFFENSLLVEEPADPTAFFLGVDSRGVEGMQTAANKTSDLLTPEEEWDPDVDILHSDPAVRWEDPGDLLARVPYHPTHHDARRTASKKAQKVTTECASCFQPVTVDTEALTVSTTIPSNGKRGQGHVPAHDVTEDALLDAEGDLVLWECPACGYADSTYADPEVRRTLSKKTAADFPEWADDAAYCPACEVLNHYTYDDVETLSSSYGEVEGIRCGSCGGVVPAEGRTASREAKSSGTITSISDLSPGDKIWFRHDAIGVRAGFDGTVVGVDDDAVSITGTQSKGVLARITDADLTAGEWTLSRRSTKTSSTADEEALDRLRAADRRQLLEVTDQNARLIEKMRGRPEYVADVARLERQNEVAFERLRSITSGRTAINETLAPAQVDTLRDENCPVCGETDSYDGDKCLVCNFIKPPDEFLDPNLEKAKQVDLRQDQNAEADTAAQDGAADPNQAPGDPLQEGENPGQPWLDKTKPAAADPAAVPGDQAAATNPWEQKSKPKNSAEAPTEGDPDAEGSTQPWKARTRRKSVRAAA